MSDTSPASQHTAYGPHEDPPTDYATAVRGHPNPSETHKHIRFPSNQSSIEPLTETLVPDMQTEIMLDIMEREEHKALKGICESSKALGLVYRALNPTNPYIKLSRKEKMEFDEDIDDVQKLQELLGKFLALRATPGTDEMKATLQKGVGAKLAMLLRMAEAATKGMTAKQLVKKLRSEGYSMNTYNSLLPHGLRPQDEIMEITEVSAAQAKRESKLKALAQGNSRTRYTGLIHAIVNGADPYVVSTFVARGEPGTSIQAGGTEGGDVRRDGA